MRDLRAFRGLAAAALRASGAAVSSGLVDQQAWFPRCRVSSMLASGRCSNPPAGFPWTSPSVDAEDLVVMKAFADRQRDWADIEGVLVRRGDALDWEYIRRHLAPLALVEEAPWILSRLETLRLPAQG